MTDPGYGPAPMSELRHRQVDTNGISTHVAESGPEDGRPVLELPATT